MQNLGFPCCCENYVDCEYCDSGNSPVAYAVTISGVEDGSTMYPSALCCLANGTYLIPYVSACHYQLDFATTCDGSWGHTSPDDFSMQVNITASGSNIRVAVTYTSYGYAMSGIFYEDLDPDTNPCTSFDDLALTSGGGGAGSAYCDGSGATCTITAVNTTNDEGYDSNDVDETPLCTPCGDTPCSLSVKISGSGNGYDDTYLCPFDSYSTTLYTENLQYKYWDDPMLVRVGFIRTSSGASQAWGYATDGSNRCDFVLDRTAPWSAWACSVFSAYDIPASTGSLDYCVGSTCEVTAI